LNQHFLELVCNIFPFALLAAFYETSFIFLDTTCELLYFSSALRLAVIGKTVSFQIFKPVTYWQIASNCLQSRQGSQTVQLVPLDFEGGTRNFGANARPIWV